ncbi:MAG TPA: threonine ammonia-lyase [Candidatus Thermoplasmatota archaeon]|nr:threonine ammonia-lyase [Candidatus Thermoplasmatota archaeon]
MAPPLALSDIEQARKRLSGVVLQTPLIRSATFSAMTGGEVWIKQENLQKTGSYKIRGAYNRIANLPPETLRRGVVAASSGNHAQGVAYAARLLSAPATIFMPRSTPLPKIEATRGYGAEVVLEGDVYDEAYAAARSFCEREGRTFVHPFEDPLVMAGQGTVGLEILDELPEFDVFVCPVGGGGLLAGTATAIKAKRPGVRIVGVQPEGSNAMHLSFRRGALTSIPSPMTIADGVSVKRPGEATFAILRALADDVVTVSDADIARAMMLYLERAKMVVEAAGAASLAALLSGAVDVRGKRAVVLASGGNVDLNTVGKIIFQGLLAEGRYAYLAAVLEDKPGQLERLLHVVAQEGANVISINHDRIAPEVPAGCAMVELDLETMGREHTARLRKAVAAARFRLVE